MFQISYTYKNLNPRDKKFLQEYLPKKLERFHNLMKRFEQSECRLEIKAEAFATKAAYMVELSLYLPKVRLMAKEDDHTIIEATDLAVDKLIIQLRKLINKK
jgi:ribosomal subunit interface protein